MRCFYNGKNSRKTNQENGYIMLFPQGFVKLGLQFEKELCGDESRRGSAGKADLHIDKGVSRG